MKESDQAGRWTCELRRKWGSGELPEGIVEVAIDDEEEWAEVTVQISIGGMAPDAT